MADFSFPLFIVNYSEWDQKFGSFYPKLCALALEYFYLFICTQFIQLTTDSTDEIESNIALYSA